MNNKISSSIKTFLCTVAFVLTFTFAFANSTENNTSKCNQLTFKNFLQTNNFSDPIALTLSYDVSTFCARTTGISTPKVSEENGVFKSKRTSNGKGSLVINESTGLIDHYISDAGVYSITYTVGITTVTTTVTVNVCNK